MGLMDQIAVWTGYFTICLVGVHCALWFMEWFEEIVFANLGDLPTEQNKKDGT